MFKSWLFVTALVVVFSSTAFAIEQPKYKVVEKDESFEVRDYEAMVMVAAPMKEEGREGENQSFRKLFKYISKGNEGQQKIKMTSPVFVGKKDDAEEKMYFVVPADVVEAGVPEPVDKSLKVVKVKAQRYAVYRYSGRSNEEKRKKAELLLMEWVKEKKMKTKGVVFGAGYNPPWTPGILRRNEVFVAVVE